MTSETRTPAGIIIPDFSPPEPEPDPDERPIEALERAAKAVAARMSSRRGGHTAAPWWCSPERREALEYARATLEALREPLEWMILKADRKASSVLTDPDANLDPYTTWQIMIDAALEDLPK